MRSLILHVLLVLAVICLGKAAEEPLVVTSESTGHKWQQRGWLAIGSSSHGDGIVDLDFIGKVVEIVDGKDVPVSGVRFSVVPDRSFASGINSRIIFLSNLHGKFHSRLYVGAAYVGDGKNQSQLYQSKASKIRIEKDGFEVREILFDYNMPEVIIHLKRKAEQDPTVKP